MGPGPTAYKISAIAGQRCQVERTTVARGTPRPLKTSPLTRGTDR
jgi:hypothetical protein